MAPTPRQLKALARVGSTAIAVAALLVIVGWLTDSPDLRSLRLPGPNLKTNAAVALLSAALANLLLIPPAGPWRQRTGMLLALVTSAIGGLTLLQHLLGLDLGIDQLLATEPPGAFATISPNRMGPPSATASLGLGLSLLLIDRAWRPARIAGQLCAFLTCGIALLPLIGVAYGFEELYSIANVTGVAMITASALLVLGIAVQAGRPRTGLAALICRDDEVGAFSRQLLLAAHALPLGLGWLLSQLLRAGLIDAAFAIAAMALVLTMLIAAMIWRTSVRLAEVSDERAATQRALREREQSLLEADQQKSDFIATLSHELRNPLAPIRFAVELLDGPPRVAERARHTIERQVKHLAHLVDDLLDLTRVTRNNLELRVRPSELRPLIEDAIDAVAPALQDSRHPLELALPAERVWLQVDPDRVVQMIVNLLGNAIRYSDPGTAVRVRASAADGVVAITVSDSGHGIDAADIERVFDRFVQVGPQRHGGLGIGLALVRALADLHGGSVTAESAGIGKGASFTLRLPQAPAPADADVEATAPAAIPVRPHRVLVVDDNRDAADMLGTLLTTSGHHVRVAYDGVTALQEAAAFRPEFGLLDIGMPGMDGYQLAQRLRDAPGGAELVLVAVTGWGQVGDRRRALASGFDAHLTKPVAPEALEALFSARAPRGAVPAARTS